MGRHVRIKGFATAVRKIEALARAGGQANVSGLRIAAEEVRTDVSASRPGAGVPRDEGVLAASGRVEGPDQRGVVQLTYGGAAAPYALRQHEDMTLQHQLGEARYLNRGVERWVAEGGPMKALRENAAAAIRAAVRES